MTTSKNTIMNIAGSLQETAAQLGSAPAIIEAKSGYTVSFEEIDKQSDDYAWHLEKAGLGPGDRVMLMVKPSADFITLTFALFKLGAPVILIDPGMGYKNLLRCISKVNPVAFIGIPKAHLFFKIFRNHFSSVKYRFCCGQSFGLFGKNLCKPIRHGMGKFPLYKPQPDDLAAIIFTTGSTGPPKGVRYEHSIFAAQLQHIRNYYGIGEGDVDQPAFPLFGLFSTSLGVCAIIPDMDASKPAKVKPQLFINSLNRYGVTYSFGSPALWNVVSNYCLKNDIKLLNLKKVLMAGAPVSGDLLKKVKAILPDDAEIHIPYGATESLPIVSIEATEILEETWQQSMLGKGTCVGRSLPGIDVGIITISKDELKELTPEMFCRPYEIGEIIVSGNVVTRAYDNNERETRFAKTYYNGKLWHRMGDTGYQDESGRLWFCGREGHRLCIGGDPKYTICCEAIINNHRDVYRSALVAADLPNNKQVPVIIIEKMKNSGKSEREIQREVQALAAKSPLTADIEVFLFHRNFPVDIRHNAKIFREKLAIWASKQLAVRK